jgi:DNA-directed RNA polymerase specialized sigma24 family protein
MVRQRIQPVIQFKHIPLTKRDGNNEETGMKMHGTSKSVISPFDAVKHARQRLDMERSLEQVSESLFDTIVKNEIGAATVLATRMLGNYEKAADTVFVALENARSEFGEYDGSSSPREWVLGYVAEEAVRRSTMQTSPARCDSESQHKTGETLQSLGPDRRLAVILTDVVGMTDEAAARISGIKLSTLRHSASVAQAWLVLTS